MSFGLLVLCVVVSSTNPSKNKKQCKHALPFVDNIIAKQKQWNQKRSGVSYEHNENDNVLFKVVNEIVRILCGIQLKIEINDFIESTQSVTI